MNSIFKEILVFNPRVYHDKRGFFYESYSKEMEGVLQQNFAQDNHSCSNKHVIRGLHYQWNNPMGKLVRVATGSIIDYFVDIRKASPTYGQYDSILLNDKNRTAIWIPPGFAHGFETLEDNTIVLYKCSNYYNGLCEGGINPFDSQINIPWYTDPAKRIVSDRDLNSQTLIRYSADPKF